MSDCKDCAICFKPSRETKVMLASLRMMIKKKIRDNAEEFEVEQKKGEKGSLNRILQIICGAHVFSSSATQKCSHSFLLNNLKKKLRCSCQKLSTNIEQLIYQLAENNFHLDMLTKQITGMSNKLSKNRTVDEQQDGQIIVKQELIDEKEKSEDGNLPVLPTQCTLKIQHNVVENSVPKQQQNIFFVPFFIPNQMGHFFQPFWI